MKTYSINEPCICFQCCCVYDGIDSHVVCIHFSHRADEYNTFQKCVGKKIEEILFSKSTFPKDQKHNDKETIEDIKSIRLSPNISQWQW